MESFWELQTAVNLLFQSLGGWLEVPMRMFTFLGQEQFFMLIMPAVYWCLDAGLGLRLGLILMASGIGNHYLKLAFHTPRPYWINPQVKASVLESSFSMPSGHSQNSASLWGRLAAATARPWLRASLVVLVIMIGLSRIYLGVHYLTDVLSGWALGALLVWAFLRWERSAVAWVKQQPAAKLAALAFLLSMLVILVNTLILSALAGWEQPVLWETNASLDGLRVGIDPLSSAGLISEAGTLFGLLAGAIWIRQRGGYCATGSGWKIPARYLLGAAGVVVIWYGLDQVFLDGSSIPALGLRYLRYGLAGAWISGIAPYLFCRLGWAHHTEQGPQLQPELAS